MKTLKEFIEEVIDYINQRDYGEAESIMNMLIDDNLYDLTKDQKNTLKSSILALSNDNVYLITENCNRISIGEKLKKEFKLTKTAYLLAYGLDNAPSQSEANVESSTQE